MTFPAVRFVASPDPDAAVRFDFNEAGEWADEDVWPDHEGVSLGTPTLEGDPDAVGVEYGFRQLTFNLKVKGSKSVAAQVMSRLARELLRRTNWLEFQLSPFSSPVWFRTYRTAPGALDFENVNDIDDEAADEWGIGVTLDADPFAYGQRITMPMVTIGNDPTTGTNPCLYVLPEIQGDAPAPLRLRIADSVAEVRVEATALLSVMPSDLAPTTGYGNMSSISASTDTTLVTGDTNSPGGNLYRISFATQTALVTRLAGGFSGLVHGSYKVLARVRASASDSTFSLQLAVSSATFGVVTITPNTGYQYVDLGQIDFPIGGRIADDFLPGVSEGSALSPQIQAGRTSGTATLDISNIVLIPIAADDGEADLATFEFYTANLPETLTKALYVDSETESARLVGGTDMVISRGTRATIVRGGYPYATPGVRNVLRYFQTIVAPDTDTLTRTADIEISYQPRWLWLAS